MKEIVVISGKGGTGKTSMVASFARLAGRVVCADCDVDAANLHIVTKPVVRETTEFIGGTTAVIDPDACTGCGRCHEVCRFGAVLQDGSVYDIDGMSCEGCGVCAAFCPEKAITMEPAVNGEWYVSDTDNGPLIHARLLPGSDNSGKLVTEVRRAARRVAEEKGIETIIVDGSPGIGCPVIASVTGSDAVVAVTEPSLSAMHDLKRVIDLARHFEIKTLICVNKSDINEDITGQIREMAEKSGIPFAGTVRFDEDFTRAQICGKSISEFSDGTAASDVSGVWEFVRSELGLED
jgi:MinD superfamily P-loop ATPase